MGAFWAIVIAAAVGGLIYWTSVQRRLQATQGYFAACEYWVYLPGDKLPDQDDVMTMMVARNPHTKGGRSPIGPREGIVFSDIRLSTALVLRSKNPHIFRPDLFGEVEIDADRLKALAASKSLVKIRYISTEPLADERHLQFLPHLADAYSQLGKSTVIFDFVTEKLYDSGEFHQAVGAEFDTSRPEFHVRVTWKKEDGQARAETKGMIKRGLPELVTAEAPPDNERLVVDVLTEAACQAWKRGEHLDVEVVEYFGDRFEVREAPTKERHRTAHIVRYQEI